MGITCEGIIVIFYLFAFFCGGFVKEAFNKKNKNYIFLKKDCGKLGVD